MSTFIYLFCVNFIVNAILCLRVYSVTFNDSVESYKIKSLN